MPNGESARVTELLMRWSSGERDCVNDLFPLIQCELREIARRHMRHERPGHILQTTALINEAYLRLVNQTQVSWQNRAHFFGIAARLMREILVDHARSVRREKRGGGEPVLTLDEVLVLSPEKSIELIALDEALNRLATLDLRKAQVVDLRHFGGLSVEEAGEVLGVSPNTVIRDWRLAKAWLKRELEATGRHAS